MILNLGGSSLHFETTVVAGTVPVLLLHAALGAADEMRTLRAQFADRSTILVDLPGHGQSTHHSDSLTTVDMAGAINSLLDRLSVRQVDVVGYSLGGYVGLELGAIAPARVRSVFSHAMKFYWTPEGIEAAVATFGKAKIAERTIHLTSTLIRDFLNRRLTVAEIQKAGIPALITTGELDEFVTAAEVTRLWNEIGTPNVSFAIFPATGHSLRKLSLDLFEQTVREFWASFDQQDVH